ncbi:MAG TPA: hypothetical protein PLF84_07370 [Bryobacteraceae bacterium]|nr:hypothetical protein [Bryobacteraceae bacterium]
MTKKKTYPNLKFPLEALVKVRHQLDAASVETGTMTTHDLLIVESDGEEWGFDSESEFFAAYRKDIDAGYYVAKNTAGRVVLNYASNRSTITVESTARDLIEECFLIFEQFAECVPKVSTSDSLNSNTSTDAPPPAMQSQPTPKVYSAVTPVPSCTVGEKLLRRIEDYLLHKLPEELGFVTRRGSTNYSVRMYGANGDERFPKLSGNELDPLPDDLSRIIFRVDYRWHDSNYVSIDVSFSSNRSLARIECTCHHLLHPRRIVDHTFGQILDIVNRFRNRNYLYHPSGSFEGSQHALPVLMVFCFGLSILLYTKAGFAVATAPLLLSALMLIYYLANQRLKPYSSFDTNAQRAADSRWTWLMRLLAGALFVGILRMAFSELSWAIGDRMR